MTQAPMQMQSARARIEDGAHEAARERAGARLARLGFGAAPIGNLYREVSDAQARDALEAAWRAGIRLFDTAPHYGFGLSELRLGAFLKGRRREEFSVSTKVGRTLEPIVSSKAAGVRHGFVNARPFEPVFDYSYDGVMRSFEDSLKRLGLDRVDILYAHDLGRRAHGSAHEAHWRAFRKGGWRAMRRLREEGAAGALGLGANEWRACLDALEEFDMEVFLLAGRYTLLEQEPVERFLPACLDRGAAVFVGGVFNSGVLATGPSAVSRYDYQRASEPVRRRVAAIAEIAQAFGVAAPAAALAFPLYHSAVARALVGFASAAEVKDAVVWAGADIPRALWARLREAGLLDSRAPAPDLETA
ncbi:aldo/keto reductase [Amphiplicatus metriothermophilus]|uniref:D-threo-aldose 1-dehydrogenase n=1 Tax=Amphiplicatus metriothermophilus TaxID=1519374 RepID=A0A239PV86_9PROT|nr:aldo/keto reductase [Amphiplicatus metriothermophilus]MBB5519651.1 D-threo-aldose 1-dehydrogenase [Amphiplicatus metriothermophilus]SNT74214.1 D-threo-aldose 1-dehydrogenase [Amphiplicatus metriothermophilus]